MRAPRGTVFGCLDALPYALVAGVLTFVAAFESDSGLFPIIASGIAGLAVLSILASISIATYHADGRSFGITRTVLDFVLYWP